MIEHACTDFKCASSSFCIDEGLTCDGISHCPDSSDEDSFLAHCPTDPGGLLDNFGLERMELLGYGGSAGALLLCIIITGICVYRRRRQSPTTISTHDSYQKTRGQKSQGRNFDPKS
ncbi:unnamed protein product [Darwinula stevensoni]|uniref:Uncharacterized protein n=1 Tax=Darwinula stevensoni TaxID=69355 RepID=A0A7R8WY55_9CRUS|nr:unnamed protein product [Darwinula stevensoni]CAG0879017.1 unnamed protein product [Darwinula stevensoni]